MHYFNHQTEGDTLLPDGLISHSHSPKINERQVCEIEDVHTFVIAQIFYKRVPLKNKGKCGIKLYYMTTPLL